MDSTAPRIFVVPEGFVATSYVDCGLGESNTLPVDVIAQSCHSAGIDGQGYLAYYFIDTAALQSPGAAEGALADVLRTRGWKVSTSQGQVSFSEGEWTGQANVQQNSAGDLHGAGTQTSLQIDVVLVGHAPTDSPVSVSTGTSGG